MQGIQETFLFFKIQKKIKLADGELVEQEGARLPSHITDGSILCD